MNVLTKLVILNIDFKQSAPQILLNNIELPEKFLDQNHPFEVCRDILNDCLEMDVEWVNFLLVDIDFDGTNLILYYTCLIPNVINNTKYKWHPIGEIINEDIRQVVLKAGQEAIAHRATI